MASISSDLFDFLNQLSQHNNREWFQDNRKRYEKEKRHFEEFIQEMIGRLGQFEDLSQVAVKDCNYRIARDVRFSKNKDPYKTWFSASFSQGGRKSGRMDYYVHIQPGESFIGGGMYAPTPEQLAKFRQEIDYNEAVLRGIIEAPDFQKVYPQAWGNAVKTAPKGYDKAHPAIDLLRRQQLFFMHTYTEAEVLAPDFTEKLAQDCRVLKPYLDFLNVTFFE
jgi:uncharacterized protein (TIGR02453 family)